MFDRLLVGVDGAQGGRDAIVLAGRLANPGASLALAHVYPWSLGKGAGSVMPMERSQARELLERERELAGVDAELLLRASGSPARGLHELAEQWQADAIVVGSCRRSLLGRVMLGDDARAALDGASCALAVAPRGYAQTDAALLRVGVAYDASLESEHALELARALADREGGEVKALQVVSFYEVGDRQPSAFEAWPAAIEREVDRCAERLSTVEGVTGVVTYGVPGEELVGLAKGLDLLIAGSRGYGPVRRLIHGSVSRYLASHAPCPLLVLPRRAEAAASSAYPGADDLSEICAPGPRPSAEQSTASMPADAR